MTAKILIVDDEPTVREAIRRILLRGGWEAAQAGDAAEARRCLAEEGPFEVVLLDIVMPGEDGVELAGWILGSHSDTAVIMVTGVDDPDVGRAATRLGVYGYLLKPIVAEQLIITVDNALKRRKLEMAQRVYVAELERLVGERTLELGATRSSLESSRAALADAQARLAGLLESREEPVLLVSPQGLVTHLNAKARALVGLGPGEDPSAGLAVMSSAPRSGPLLAALGSSQTLEGHQVLVVRKDGAVVEATATLLALDAEGPRSSGLLCVLRDGAPDSLEALRAAATTVVRDMTGPAQYASFSARYLQESFGSLDRLLAAVKAVAEGRGGGEAVAALERAAAETDIDELRREIPAAVSEVLEGVGRISRTILGVSGRPPQARPDSPWVDVSSVADAARRAVLRTLPCLVELDLQPRLPSVRGRRDEVRRVVEALLRRAASTPGRLIRLATALRAGAVELRVEWEPESGAPGDEVAAGRGEADLEPALAGERRVVEGLGGSLLREGPVSSRRGAFVVRLPTGGKALS